MDKVMTAAQAVSELEDGMTVGIGGWGPRRKPMGLVREILRTDLKDLTVVSYGGADVGMLCATGKVKKVIFAFVSLDFIPLEPYFRMARQNQNIEVLELDEGMLMLGLKAAAIGAPYIPTKVGLGTDIIVHATDIKVIESPYDDKDWVAMPALNLDAALIHVDRADARGVCQINGPDHYMDDLFARASEKTIVSCDELVDQEYFRSPGEARQVFWERSATSSVVPMAGGAHPSSCAPLYGFDIQHFKEYCASSKEGGIDLYLDKYITGKTEEDYLQHVGGVEHIQNLPLPIY